MNKNIEYSTTLIVLLAFSLMAGCAKDRTSSSGCCESNTTFSQNYSASQPSALDRYRAENASDSASDSSGKVVQNKACPVTGEPVDSMGGAIPVSANGYTISVCCQGCVGKVQNDPAKYLAIARRQDDGGTNYQPVSYGGSGCQSGKCH